MYNVNLAFEFPVCISFEVFKPSKKNMFSYDMLLFAVKLFVRHLPAYSRGGHLHEW